MWISNCSLLQLPGKNITIIADYINYEVDEWKTDEVAQNPLQLITTSPSWEFNLIP